MSSPGKTERGFATLDTVMAIVVLSLAWSAAYPAFHHILRLNEQQVEVLSETAAVETETGRRGWSSWDDTAE